jgi:hypothetical protein
MARETRLVGFLFIGILLGYFELCLLPGEKARFHCRFAGSVSFFRSSFNLSMLALMILRTTISHRGTAY